MRKNILIGAIMCAFGMMTSCKNDDLSNKDLIVGKWDVLNVHEMMDDHTAGTHEDYIISPTDSVYVGYDSVRFNDDQTTRWYMSKRYVHDGMYPYSYKDFNWYVDGDSLIIWAEHFGNRWRSFVIKELNRNTLVIEEYYNRPAEYSHHHMEGTECFTFKRTE